MLGSKALEDYVNFSSEDELAKIDRDVHNLLSKNSKHITHDIRI